MDLDKTIMYICGCMSALTLLCASRCYRLARKYTQALTDVVHQKDPKCVDELSKISLSHY